MDCLARFRTEGVFDAFLFVANGPPGHAPDGTLEAGKRRKHVFYRAKLFTGAENMRFVMPGKPKVLQSTCFIEREAWRLASGSRFALRKCRPERPGAFRTTKMQAVGRARESACFT